MLVMRWYGHMGEVDPYQFQCLEDLRRSKLRPHAARMVLWSAGCRIVGDAAFSAEQRRQAGVYLEAIMGVVDSLERDGHISELRRASAPELLSMGHLMGWAFLEIHLATFGHAFNPSDRSHQDAAVQMQLTVGAIEDHLTDAYRQYVAYEEAQARNPRQTEVVWY